MIPRRWLLTAAALVGLAVAGVYGRSWWFRYREQVAAAQAVQRNTAATVAAAQGGVHDQAEAVQAQTVREAQARAAASNVRADAAEREVARLRDALARVRPGGAGAPVYPAVPGVPGDQPDGAPADLAPVVAAQDALIKGLDAQHEADKAQHEADQQVIGALQLQVVDLTAARDAWRTSAQEREQEAAAQRIAHEAALHAARAERWKGRFEGAPSGYLIGKGLELLGVL